MRLTVATILACDFCGKSQDDVEALVRAARDVAICSGCVQVCVDTLAECCPDVNWSVLRGTAPNVSAKEAA